MRTVVNCLIGFGIAYLLQYVLQHSWSAGKRWLRRRRERLKVKRAGELVASEINQWYGKGL